jgi:fatty-acid peroxygenase
MGLYGTNRDPRSWENPEAFRPERFRGLAIGPYEFIPQGGGAHADTHRCPGEWVTMGQMKIITRLLVREMRCVVPDQDLGIDLGRLPALPNSGFVMRDAGLVAPPR